MNTRTSSSTTGRLSGRHARLAHGFRHLLNRAALGWQAWQRARRLRRDEADFQRIDAATLRDLGMSFSEHASHWAEAEGLAPQTRERVRRDRRQGGW
jgi:hypothetical protein